MATRRQTLGIIARHEIRVLIADRSLAIVIGLLAVLLSYAFYNGLNEASARDDMIVAVLQAEKDAARANLEALQRIERGAQAPGPFDNPANPAVTGNGSGRHAVIHTLPLAPVAIGQSDMMPNYYRIGTRSKVEFMHDSEIGSPWTLLSGHFDLSFVIVFLLPLLIFALTFNLLSAEREDGIQRMLLSQPLGIGTLVLGKLLPRMGILLAVASILPVALLLAFRPEARGVEHIPALLGWMGIVIAYGLFWFALAFLVNSLGMSSWANALVLVAAWTGIVLVLPVLLNILAEQAHPSPSRTELAIQTRAIQADNLRQYDDLFSGDYRYIDEPESLMAVDGRIEIPARTRASFLARRDMDRRVDALLKNFDEAVAGQQALVDRLSILSPAVLAYEGVTELAGTDGRRYLAFREDVSRFHNAWRTRFEPLILDGIALSQDDLLDLPQWQSTGERQSATSAWRLAAMIGVALLLALLGAASLRRYRRA